jgi:hypothetical protein
MQQIIDENKITTIINQKKNPTSAEINLILKKARMGRGLNTEEVAALISIPKSDQKN